MTLQAFLAAARGRANAIVLAALVALTVGATAAVQHVHVEDEDEEHCSFCAIGGVEDVVAPAPASTPRLSASVAPIGDLDELSCPTPLHAYRARAPPLSH